MVGAAVNPHLAGYGGDYLAFVVIGLVVMDFQQIGVTSLIGPWFDKLAGTEMVPIPYKDYGLMMQDTVAGRIPMVMTTFEPSGPRNFWIASSSESPSRTTPSIATM